MDILERIPAETIQRLKPFQAWEYRLVPYGQTTDTLSCYGSMEVDYTPIYNEIEVVLGWHIEIEAVPEADIVRLLRHYYNENRTASAKAGAQTGGDKFLMNLIQEAYINYVSDIHIETYGERCRVRFRMDGKLIEKYVIDRQNYPALINQIKILANLDISEKRLPQDGRIFYKDDQVRFDVRVSSMPTIYGEKIVLRLLTRHSELLDLSNLGFSRKQYADYLKAIEKPYGIVLISGPTGSGKSTTLYATLRLLNKEQSNILTIEDPVEYTLEGVNQVQLKEEIGLTFGSALRTFLRQDPDIIMLGEIRDPDTAQMAVRSSLTGHLIFSTIHTNSAWGSIARLVDMGIHPYLISSTLVLSVAQRLMRTLCQQCKKEVPGNGHPVLPSDIHSYYEAVGCEHCYYTGYKGRKAIYEVVSIDETLAQAIRDTVGDISRLLEERGITTLRESAMTLFRRGETSIEELLPLLNYQ